ncbi:kinase [Alishewanella sp. BS5-314]|nr:kinase [Alishewanella sp. BS5-314]
MLSTLSRQLRAQNTPAVIGITGAQGTGKSTLASLLVTELLAQGMRCAAVSLDDYYLTRQARQQLAGTVHPLLAQRGVPGTHDIGRALSDARQVLAGAAVALPRFDKALDDSLPKRPAAQLDLLIVEGWCLGLAAEAEPGLASPVNQLEATEDSSGAWRRYVNQQLAASYQPYFDLLQPLIWLKAPDWDSVCRWRAKQEQQLWQQRGTGMTAEQLARFMLPFQRLTQLSYQQLPARVNYTIVLNQAQQPQLSG